MSPVPAPLSPLSAAALAALSTRTDELLRAFWDGVAVEAASLVDADRDVALDAWDRVQARLDEHGIGTVGRAYALGARHAVQLALLRVGVADADAYRANVREIGGRRVSTPKKGTAAHLRRFLARVWAALRAKLLEEPAATTPTSCGAKHASSLVCVREPHDAGVHEDRIRVPGLIRHFEWWDEGGPLFEGDPLTPALVAPGAPAEDPQWTPGEFAACERLPLEEPAAAPGGAS